MTIDTFRYFYSALAQSMAALFALCSVFVIFQLQYLIEQHDKTCKAFKEYMRRTFTQNGMPDDAKAVDEWLNKDIFFNLLIYFETFKKKQPKNLQPAFADYFAEYINQENFKHKIKLFLWIPTALICLSLLFSFIILHNTDYFYKYKSSTSDLLLQTSILNILTLYSIIRYIAFSIRGYKKENINNLLSIVNNDIREERIRIIENEIFKRLELEKENVLNKAHNKGIDMKTKSNHKFFKLKIFNKLRKWPWHNIFMVIATITIAVATWQNKNIASELSKIQKQNANHNEAALKAEFRPYLIYKLAPSIYEKDLKIADGIGIYFEYSNQDNFILPFRFENSGKIAALNVNPTWTGEGIEENNNHKVKLQNPTPIASPGEIGHIMPEGSSSAITTHRPQINLQSIKNKKINKLYITLEVKYQGNHEIDDNRVYSSKLLIEFEKKQMNDKLLFILTDVTEEYDTI